MILAHATRAAKLKGEKVRHHMHCGKPGSGLTDLPSRIPQRKKEEEEEAKATSSCVAPARVERFSDCWANNIRPLSPLASGGDVYRDAETWQRLAASK